MSELSTQKGKTEPKSKSSAFEVNGLHTNPRCTKKNQIGPTNQTLPGHIQIPYPSILCFWVVPRAISDFLRNGLEKGTIQITGHLQASWSGPPMSQDLHTGHFLQRHDISTWIV